MAARPEALVQGRPGPQAGPTRARWSSRSRGRPAPPGKYKVIWDGKDDHGKPVPAGEYTICIEAAREHGTYQSIRKEVTIADKPFTEELKGNVEIKSASIEYRRKASAAKASQ